MPMSKSHKVVVSVTFDQPCTKAEAVDAFRDCIHGIFYPTILREAAPLEFKIRGIKAAPEEKRYGRT